MLFYQGYILTELTSGFTCGGTIGLPAPNTMLGERSLLGRGSELLEFCLRLFANRSKKVL